jgi:hypothetical protein
MDALVEAKDVTKLSLKPNDVLVFRMKDTIITEAAKASVARHMKEVGIKNKTLMISKDVEIFVVSQEEAMLESL